MGADEVNGRGKIREELCSFLVLFGMQCYKGILNSQIFFIRLLYVILGSVAQSFLDYILLFTILYEPFFVVCS